MQTSPFFSIIIPYRNREIWRIKHCLNSLAWQTFQDFEIIFIDYGTTALLQQKVEDTVKKFDKTTYIYAESRGMFWNRSQALNIGLYYAQGKKMMITDVDLVFAPSFLAIAQKFSEKFSTFLYPCIPLTPKSPEISTEKLFEQQHIETKDWYYGGGGNIIFQQDILKIIGGYNEYYRIWGYEDIDLVKRIEKNAISVGKLPTETVVLHQWHLEMVHLPKGWRQLGYQQLKHNQAAQVGLKPIPAFTLKDRPALRLFETYENLEKVPLFNFPKEYFYALWLQKIRTLEQGQAIFFEQDFQNPVNTLKNWRKILKWINNMLKKMNISYRIVDLQTFHHEPLIAEPIHSFFFYLILTNLDREHWDYYYHYENEKIQFLLYRR